MLKELEKSGLSLSCLNSLSFETKLGKSLVNSLRRFESDELFDELYNVRIFYQANEILDDIALDYRVKSDDSCRRKYLKFFPEMRVEKVFNDMIGFRMLVEDYSVLLQKFVPQGFRIVDMSGGKARDDGYRGVHVYYQPDHFHYPVEIQANTYYDRQINNWLHKFVYKKGYEEEIGRSLRQAYEHGKIQNEKMFKEVLYNVLLNSKKI